MNLTAFLSYIFLTAYTPGPNNIMAMNNAGRLGFKKGLRFCLGVLLGFLAVMLLCVAFTTILFHYIPKIEPVMKWVGAAYILLLAWTVFRDKPHTEKKHSLRTNSVFTGAVMQLINVKVILYGITAFTTFILPYYKSAPELALFIAILSLTGFSGTCCWALFGSLFQKVFTSRRKLLNIVMALLLVYCALSSVVHF